MNSRTVCFVFLLGLAIISNLAAQDEMKLDPFGTVRLFKSGDASTGMVLFLSGDGGWEDKVAQVARAVAATGTLVAGINMDDYVGPQKGRDWKGCPSTDLETLTARLLEKEKINGNKRPILLGYSSGATLAYAALLEAPTSFSGAVTLGFCPDLRGMKPCTGERLRWHHTNSRSNTILLDPETRLPMQWIAIQGETDIACGPDKIAAFIKQVPGARMVTAKHVTHGFNVPDDYVGDVIDALRAIQKAAPK